MLVYQTNYRSQSVSAVQVVQKHFSKVTLIEKIFDFYSDIRIFFGGFTAAKIWRRILLADFFRLIFGG